MALKHGKPNSLNFLDLRRVRFPARHFHYTTLDKFHPNKMMQLENWVMQNLNSRFYLGQTLILNNTNSICYATKIGFEDEKELSFFLLSYSDL
jgi:hypothetical protein